MAGRPRPGPLPSDHPRHNKAAQRAATFLQNTARGCAAFPSPLWAQHPLPGGSPTRGWAAAAALQADPPPPTKIAASSPPALVFP
jgi:hypothetical protein